VLGLESDPTVAKLWGPVIGPLVAMVLAGYLVEVLFGALDLVPADRSATVVEASFSWNYTSWLNLAFLVLTALLLLRFVRTGGVPMLRMTGGGAPDAHDEHHDHR